MKSIFRTRTQFLIIVLSFFVMTSAYGATELDEGGNSQSDEKQAEKYFRKSERSTEAQVRPSSSKREEVSSDDHYLALHLGGFITSDAYKWGQIPHVTDPGRINGGLTYRISPWGTLFDWVIRGDFIGYDLPENRALQFGLIPMIMFPESSSKFPLYFGIGAGPGVFFQQIQGESYLAFDYQLVAGARMFNVVDSMGFFIESGLKNHILLLEDGQFNGVFLAAGVVFAF